MYATLQTVMLSDIQYVCASVSLRCRMAVGEEVCGSVRCPWGAEVLSRGSGRAAPTGSPGLPPLHHLPTRYGYPYN